MATRCSWLFVVVVIICAIHFNSLDVDAFKKEKDGECCCYPQYDCCDTGNTCPDYCCKKKYKSKKPKCYDDDDDCSCEDFDCSTCCSDKDKKKNFKEDLKEKIFKKFVEKKEKKEKKKKEKDRKKKKPKCCKKCCCSDDDEDDDKGNDDPSCCDSSQKIIVEKGPAIIQTIIVDKDLYMKYGIGCCEFPLQKVYVQDEDCCYYPSPNCNNWNNCCPTCPEECEPQNVKVIVKDPGYRSCYYPGYCY